jgi:dTDP-glucose pyrophosphorylase
MSDKLALIIPAAGRGSRFAKQGMHEPKPLLSLLGQPFFHWAVQSVARGCELRQLIFVVLQEHIERHQIDQRIKALYPQADLVVLPDVTSGAAETAWHGVSALKEDGPIAFNDCDHAFEAPGLDLQVQRLAQGELAGSLVYFRSDNPAYSYIRLDEQGEVCGTIEKQAISPCAIAGCYLFANREVFLSHYQHYTTACQYQELFMSGVYNVMHERGERIGKLELQTHISFGTPEEMAGVSVTQLATLKAW